MQCARTRIFMHKYIRRCIRTEVPACMYVQFFVQDEKSQKNLSSCPLSNAEIATQVYLGERLLDSR